MAENEVKSDEMSKRDAVYISAAIALIMAPFLLFIGYLIIRDINPSSAKDWALVCGIVWFLVADHLLDNAAMRRRPAPWLGRFDTPTARKRLIKAFSIAPMLAFCFVDETKTGWSAVGDWGLGFVAGLIVFPIVDITTDAIGHKWKAWRKSRA